MMHCAARRPPQSGPLLAPRRADRRGSRSVAANVIVSSAIFALIATGCDQPPETTVVIDNRYPASSTSPLVVYHAYWQAVFQDAAVPPGSSSDAQSTVPASSNTAYAVLAPGWDPTTSAPPASLVVLQSRNGFEVHLSDTLHIPVDDTTFIGNCASGTPLSQAQADFITQLVFPGDFTSMHYDAASCTTTPIGDAGAP
jgi:hypothetical protein